MASTTGAPPCSAVKPTRRSTRGKCTRVMAATFPRCGAWFSRLRTQQLGLETKLGQATSLALAQSDSIGLITFYDVSKKSFQPPMMRGPPAKRVEVVMLLSFYWWHAEFSEIAGDEEDQFCSSTIWGFFTPSRGQSQSHRIWTKRSLRRRGTARVGLV